MTNEVADKKKRIRLFKLFSAEFLVIFLILVVSIIVFAYAVHMVFIRESTILDEKVFEFIDNHVHPKRTDYIVIISFLGKHDFLIPGYIILLLFYLLIKKNRKVAIRIASLALGSLCILFLLKFSFQRERPSIPLLEEVRGFSFPSGHALMSVAFYGLLIYLAWFEIKLRWLRLLIILVLVLLVLLIGLSRIYLKVHFASDVIAGFAAGISWFLLSFWAIRQLEKKFNKKPAKSSAH